MPTTARKARKRARYAALNAGDTATAELYAFTKEPKRPPRRPHETRRERQIRRRGGLRRLLDRIIPGDRVVD